VHSFRHSVILYIIFQVLRHYMFDPLLCVRCVRARQAAEFGTEMLDEDALFDLIRRLPGKKSKYQVAAENEHLQVEM